MIKHLLPIFLMILSQLSFAQVQVLGGLSQDTVVIGDAVDMTLSVEVERGANVVAVAGFFLDSIYSGLQTAKANVDTTQPVIPAIADFEVLSYGGWEDTNDDGIYTREELVWDTISIGSQLILESTFSIRMWDPGSNVMLYPSVLFIKDGEQDQATNEEQMRLFVAPPGGLPPVQDSLQVAPIKTIKEEATNFSDYLIYFIIIGLAVFGGLAYWLFTKYYKAKEKRTVEVVIPDVFVPSHEVALQKLANLKGKQLWQQGDIKTYQSELTYIIREYLEGRYDILALESTTDEIVKNLSAELSSEDDVVSLKRILQVADLVKFAKAKPDENIHESFMTEAESFVERTADETKQVVFKDDLQLEKTNNQERV